MDREITLYLPGLPVSLKNCLASFHALSTASPPPVVKKTRFRSPGAYPATRSASSIAGGVPNDHSGKKARVSACLAAASANSARPWPTCTTNSPDRPSMNLLPSLSQMCTPSPRVMMAGLMSALRLLLSSRTPIVLLFDKFQVNQGFGGYHPWDGTDLLVEEVEKVTVVLADDLDDGVEGPRGEHDVVDGF